MIRYIKGLLLKKEDDRVVVFANGVGYEILLRAVVGQT
jgi:Holliday junction resolvasome RuvABC DNA-binding subunit